MAFIWFFLALFSSGVMSLDKDEVLKNGQTVGEYLEYSGYTKEKYERMQEKLKEWRQLYDEIYGKENDTEDQPYPGVRDVIITEEGLDNEISELKKLKENGTSRAKRAAFYKPTLWGKRKFKYIISDEFDDLEFKKDVIERVIDIVEDATCIRFIEVESMAEADVFFSHTTENNDNICRAPIGDNSANFPNVPQPIYLGADWCFDTYGLVLHEVGHFLGLIHEHEKSGRCVTFNNDPPGVVSSSNMVTFQTPYDYQSIMHYPYQEIILPNDGRFNLTIGQEAELSFFDKRVLNEHYCGLCGNSDLCLNNGFRPVGKCDEDCVCPDGLDGDWCEKVEDDSDGDCEPGDEVVYAKTFVEAKGKEQCLESPDYDSGGYKPEDVCTWMIVNGKVPDDRCQIKLWFEGDFNIPTESRFGITCNNWVEVRLDAPRKQGQRFCGFGDDNKLFSDPEDGTLSQYAFAQHSVLVNFRSFLNTDESNEDRKEKGFKLCYVRECTTTMQETC